MSSEHIKTRQKVQNICSIKSFEGLLAESTLSDDDKEILRLHYLQNKDFRFIGDKLGFAESTIKRKHKKILSKLNRLLL